MAEDKTVLIEEGSEEDVSEKTELRTVKQEGDTVEEEEQEEEGTVLVDETKVERDSLVEELLSDEDVEMSGI